MEQGERKEIANNTFIMRDENDVFHLTQDNVTEFFTFQELKEIFAQVFDLEDSIIDFLNGEENILYEYNYEDDDIGWNLE